MKKVLKIIEQRKPTWFFIENPRGLLRKMPFMRDLMRHTVTYCQYGDTRMKPTDIWTNAPLVDASARVLQWVVVPCGRAAWR